MPSIPRFRDPTREYENLREAAEKGRTPFDRDILLNLAYYLGRQYVEWDPSYGTIAPLRPDPNAPNAPRPVVNKIRHMVQEAHAKAIANRPVPDVLPATDDPKDVSDASVALAYVKYLADDAVGDYDTELSEQALWALAGGEGFMKWTYDQSLGRPTFAAVSPLDLYGDPFARRFKHYRYIVHSQFMDVEEVADTYDVTDVRPTQMTKADLEKNALMRDMGYSPAVNGAVVNELWMKPGVSRAHPDGLFVVWTGRRILHEPRDFPYKHGMLPFTQIGPMGLPGTAHRTCFVTDERKPQAELNAFHQQSIRTREKFASPKWWVPDELELQAMPDDSTGQVLRGSGSQGFKPEILQPQTMANSEDGAWLRQEMQDVAGLHEVSRAQVPGRVEAAKAIELLRETDDSRLADLLKTIRVQTAVGFWQCVMLADEFVPAETIATTYSSEGLPEVQEFKLKGVNPGLRFKITMGTGLSESRAARADAAINMWQQGIIQDPEIMAEILEIPVGTIAPQRAYDIKLARNENFIIARGESLEEDGLTTTPGTPIIPNSWDAHDIHIREHNNFRKTSDYDNLPGPVKMKFEMHVQMHEVQQLQQLQKEALKQQVLAGVAVAPGPAPDDSPQQDETAAQGAAPTGPAPPEAETQTPTPGPPA